MTNTKHTTPDACREELLPCPFCKKSLIHEGSFYVHRNVECVMQNTVFHENSETAKLWNTRQQEAGVATIADYEEVLADHRRLVRELDVALNGEDGAAQQASLCDIVGQVKAEGIRAARATPQAAPAEPHHTPAGKPIFGEGSPHDVEAHLAMVAAQPHKAVAVNQLVVAIGKGIKQFSADYPLKEHRGLFYMFRGDMAKACEPFIEPIIDALPLTDSLPHKGEAYYGYVKPKTLRRGISAHISTGSIWGTITDAVVTRRDDGKWDVKGLPTDTGLADELGKMREFVASPYLIASGWDSEQFTAAQEATKHWLDRLEHIIAKAAKAKGGE